jgi:hypothetical protein
MSGDSLQSDLYMTWEDQVFVANAMIIDSMQETMVLSVISWLLINMCSCRI